MKVTESAFRSYGSARERIIKRYGNPAIRPPQPSIYIRHSEEQVRHSLHQPAILWVRTSSKSQARMNNHEDQRAALRANAEALGFKIVLDDPWIGSGRNGDRVRFELTIEKAQKLGAILLAESTDRFIRSWWWSKRKQYVQPTEVEWETFIALTRGVVLATIVHPDTDWRNVRGYQTERGVSQKGVKLGRQPNPKPGAKKQRRERLLPETRRLRDLGFSYRRIGAILGVPWPTIRDWLTLL